MVGMGKRQRHLSFWIATGGQRRPRNDGKNKVENGNGIKYPVGQSPPPLFNQKGN
jgi:hypothetical protein